MKKWKMLPALALMVLFLFTCTACGENSHAAPDESGEIETPIEDNSMENPGITDTVPEETDMDNKKENLPEDQTPDGTADSDTAKSGRNDQEDSTIMEDLGNGVENVGNGIGDGIENIGEGVGGAVKDMGNGLGDATDNLGDTTDSATDGK